MWVVLVRYSYSEAVITWEYWDSLLLRWRLCRIQSIEIVLHPPSIIGFNPIILITDSPVTHDCLKHIVSTEWFFFWHASRSMGEEIQRHMYYGSVIVLKNPILLEQSGAYKISFSPYQGLLPTIIRSHYHNEHIPEVPIRFSSSPGEFGAIASWDELDILTATGIALRAYQPCPQLTRNYR